MAYTSLPFVPCVEQRVSGSNHSYKRPTALSSFAKSLRQEQLVVRPSLRSQHSFGGPSEVATMYKRMKLHSSKAGCITKPKKVPGTVNEGSPIVYPTLLVDLHSSIRWLLCQKGRLSLDGLYRLRQPGSRIDTGVASSAAAVVPRLRCQRH